MLNHLADVERRARNLPPFHGVNRAKDVDRRTVGAAGAGAMLAQASASGVDIDHVAEAEGEANADPPRTGEAQVDAGPSEEVLKADYRKIAERRVRLGLLLAEVGRSNNITVTQDETNQAITREARRHSGYERQVLDFYRQNPEAIANLRAPIFEDKVIDFIVELAKVEERKITPQELLSTPDLHEEAAETARGSAGVE